MLLLVFFFFSSRKRVFFCLLVFIFQHRQSQRYHRPNCNCFLFLTFIRPHNNDPLLFLPFFFFLFPFINLDATSLTKLSSWPFSSSSSLGIPSYTLSIHFFELQTYISSCYDDPHTHGPSDSLISIFTFLETLPSFNAVLTHDDYDDDYTTSCTVDCFFLIHQTNRCTLSHLPLEDNASTAYMYISRSIFYSIASCFHFLNGIMSF